MNFRDFQLYCNSSQSTLCDEEDHILIPNRTRVNRCSAKLWRKLLKRVVRCRCLRQLQNRGQWVLIAPLLKLPAFLCLQKASLLPHPHRNPNLSLQNAVEKVRRAANLIIELHVVRPRSIFDVINLRGSVLVVKLKTTLYNLFISSWVTCVRKKKLAYPFAFHQKGVWSL